MALEKVECSLCNNYAMSSSHLVPAGWGCWQNGTRKIKFCGDCSKAMDEVLSEICWDNPQ